ncbi:MAG: hypothetical protein PHN57_03745 [Candidatus Omnitrophica bacterium]|nr:hypothetical protein [Candidatus Omnitrophota bacterium]
MDNKDIYEHLAEIYLDTPLKRKQRVQGNLNSPKKYIVVISLLIVLAVALIFVAVISSGRPKNKDSRLVHVVQPEAIKLNYHFDPTRKEIYSIGLNKFNLAGFKSLVFSAKKTNFKDTLSLRVEFSNGYREKSEIYLKDLSNKWKEYRINFPEFKEISDWSEMTNLSFIVEEWNSSDKAGAVYLENIRFSK